MVALAIIPAVMFTLQTIGLKLFSSKCDDSKPATTIFNSLYLIISAISVLPFIFILDKGIMDADSIIWGAIFGVSFFGFILCFNAALANGPLAITAFLFSASMAVVVIISLFLFNEKLTVLKIIGIILIIIGIYLINFSNAHRKSTEKNQFSKKWVFLCVIGVMFNILVMLSNKGFGYYVTEGSIYQYLFVGFLVAALLSLFMFIPKQNHEDIKQVVIDKWFVIFAIMVGLTSSIGDGMVAFLGGMINGSILFPVVNGGSAMLSCAAAPIFFKEKFTPRSLTGLILGIIAIVLMSI